MLSTLVILALSTATTNAQFNGEFWWLNDKLAEYKGVKPAPARYEEVSELENDQTDKVVFRDDNAADNENARSNTGSWNFRFQDQTHLTWPNERDTISTEAHNTLTTPNSSSGDVLDFKFPDSDQLIRKKNMNTKGKTMPVANNSTLQVATKNKTVFITDKVTFKVYKEETTRVQNICTYLKKGECKRRNGVVYIKRERQGATKLPTDSQFICCILPLSNDKPTKIYFADNFSANANRRHKRSAPNLNGASSALKQRNALMRRRYPNINHNTKASVSSTPTKVTHKIVTSEDDYVDPYENIKNNKFRKQYSSNNPYRVTSTKYEYGDEDYVEDYVVELPKPGLVGLYSDHRPGSSWTYIKGKTDSPYGTMDDTVEEQDDLSPGYGTIDPRLVDRVALGTSNSPKRRPSKFSTDESEEISYDTRSQTINYQANPDFHVLQGFKLVNLFRNTNRIYSKNGRKTTTTEREADSSECVKSRPIVLDLSRESNYDEYSDVNEEIFSDCGKAAKDPLKDCEHDKQAGEADVGSHPWLALTVLTKSPQSILCYASLVHLRAAVTSADCVYGRTSPGEVTMLAGVWDLNDDSSVRSQQRMALIHIHSQYIPGNLAHNLAMLHWKRPLQLGVNVQPACLTDPHVGDECKIVGWGGYDQAIRARPRWQRATILTPRQCNEQLSSSNRRVTLPPDTFCASVVSRASVTGIGGPLTCNIGGRQSVVGVAVWRDSALVMLPAHEWAVRAIASLRIQ